MYRWLMWLLPDLHTLVSYARLADYLVFQVSGENQTINVIKHVVRDSNNLGLIHIVACQKYFIMFLL